MLNFDEIDRIIEEDDELPAKLEESPKSPEQDSLPSVVEYD
jgi:hypothetical protein